MEVKRVCSNNVIKIDNCIEKLIEYEFGKEYRFPNNNPLMEDANKLNNPIMIIAPEERVKEIDGKYDLRVWAYGGCIATLSCENGKITKINVKPQRNISDGQKKQEANGELLKYVKNNEKGNVKNPYDYGKYLYDGFTDGKEKIYELTGELKTQSQKENDQLAIYKDFTKCVLKHKNDSKELDRRFLDMMVYASYTRWLARKPKEPTPLYAQEKFMQCVIAKNSMMDNKYKKDAMVVVDVEYHFIGEGHNKSRADFVVFDGESFGLIEFKYLGKSMDNLGKHYDDFNKADNQKKKSKIIEELIAKTQILCKCGVLDKSWDVFGHKSANDIGLWYGFYFLGDGEDIAIFDPKYKGTENNPKEQINLKGKRIIPLRCRIRKIDDADMLRSKWDEDKDDIKNYLEDENTEE